MRSSFYLVLVFLLVFSIRLVASFSSAGFGYDAYDYFRQASHILDTGMPLFEDDLSYGGRDRVFSPVYGYVLAFFGIFLSLDLVMVLVPNFLGSLIVVVTFYLVRLLVDDDRIGLVLAFISGLIPVLFLGTVNNGSVLNLAIPVFLLTIYYFLLTNKDNKYSNKLLFSIVFLSLIHPVSILLCIALIFHIVFIRILNFRESNREPEIVLFFILLVLWLNLVIYKPALDLSQNLFVWQNIPGVLMDLTYSQIGFVEAIYAIGSVLMILGLLSIYFNLFDKKRKSVTFLSSLLLVFVFILVFRLANVYSSLIWLGVVLCVISAYSLKILVDMIDNFKWKFASSLFLLGIVLIQVILFIPGFFSVVNSTSIPSGTDFDAMSFLSDLDGVMVLGQYFEGHFISYYSGQRSVLDSDFLLVSNIDVLFSDASSIFRERFLTGALSKLTRLEVDYIFLSETYQLRSNRTDLLFADDSCVVRVFPDFDTDYVYHSKIYAVRCVLNE